eukprot:11382293-Alexandrium_andersonii.AAC.1
MPLMRACAGPVRRRRRCARAALVAASPERACQCQFALGRRFLRPKLQAHVRCFVGSGEWLRRFMLAVGSEFEQ